MGYREAILWDLMILESIRENGKLSDQENAGLTAVREHLEESYLPVLEKLDSQKPPDTAGTSGVL